MIREKLLHSINDLVLEELETANQTFPLFASNHEAHAVMREEYEEAMEKAELISEGLDLHWEATKNNCIGIGWLEEMSKNGRMAIAELIQFVAMTEKAILSASRRDADGERTENL